MNGDGAAEARVLFRIYRVLHHHRRRHGWRLGGVPVLDGLGDSDWREGFVLFNSGVTPKPLAPADGVKADQGFFALSNCKIWNTSWMMLLLLRGDSAISSEAAATMIHVAG